jgi:hypothetical protein
MFMIAAILTGCECVYKSGAVERERSTFSGNSQLETEARIDLSARFDWSRIPSETSENGFWTLVSTDFLEVPAFLKTSIPGIPVARIFILAVANSSATSSKAP